MTEEELNELHRELEALKAQKLATNKNVSNEKTGTNFYSSQNTLSSSSENLFIKLFKYFFCNFFNFRGRASPVEFFIFCGFLGLFGTGVSDYSLFSETTFTSICDFIDFVLFFPIIIIGLISLNARRLHDANLSGWWQLGHWILFIFIILIFVNYEEKLITDIEKVNYYACSDLSCFIYAVLYLLILTSIPSNKGSNRFGPPSDFKI